MKIEKLDPLELIPTESPHKIETINSLISLYEDPEIDLDRRIPFAFVHYVRKRGLYVVDGNHKIGVAQLYSQGVNCIFLNTFRDLSDSYVMRDLGLIPYFNFGFPIEKTLPYLSRKLPLVHEEIVRPMEIETFRDFAQIISWMIESGDVQVKKAA